MIVFLPIPSAAGDSYVLLTSGNALEFSNNLADRMATADASGPFQWPLIDGMVAVNGAGGVAVESKRCSKSRLVSFSRWFPERRTGSRIYPPHVSSAVLS
jgi:hypothetical protein